MINALRYQKLLFVQKEVEMKKILLITSLTATIALPVFSASAYDGTITFNGTITNTTCNVSVNGGNKSTTVRFDPISISALSKQGEVAGEKPVNMNLTNCQNASQNVRSLFESAATDNTTGNLKNINGSAGNVQVQLLDSSHQPINLADGTQSNSPAFTIKDDMATLNYFARYYATDAVTAGEVDTLVNYSLSYF